MSAAYKRGPIHLGQEAKSTAEESLPAPNTTKDHPPKPRSGFFLNILSCLAGILLIVFYVTCGPYFPRPGPAPRPPVSDIVKRGLLQCEAIKLMPPDTSAFRVNRTISDRYEPNNAKPVLLKNATVWTGGDNGEEVLYGASIYLRGGVVVSVGAEKDVRQVVKDHAQEIDVQGRWVTPGIVDM